MTTYLVTGGSVQEVHVSLASGEQELPIGGERHHLGRSAVVDLGDEIASGKREETREPVACHCGDSLAIGREGGAEHHIGMLQIEELGAGSHVP